MIFPIYLEKSTEINETFSNCLLLSKLLNLI